MVALQLSPLVVVVSVYIFVAVLYLKLRPLLKGRRKTRMVVYGGLCNGCGNCVVVCPPNALRSSEVSGGKGSCNGAVVMDVKDGVVLEFNINACERVKKPEEEPCKLCIEACPLNAIDFTY